MGNPESQLWPLEHIVEKLNEHRVEGGPAISLGLGFESQAGVHRYPLVVQINGTAAEIGFVDVGYNRPGARMSHDMMFLHFGRKYALASGIIPPSNIEVYCTSGEYMGDKPRKDVRLHLWIIRTETDLKGVLPTGWLLKKTALEAAVRYERPEIDIFSADGRSTETLGHIPAIYYDGAIASWVLEGSRLHNDELAKDSTVGIIHPGRWFEFSPDYAEEIYVIEGRLAAGVSAEKAPLDERDIRVIPVNGGSSVTVSPGKTLHVKAEGKKPVIYLCEYRDAS